MKYNQAIIHLSDNEYEELANSVCQSILGFGTISFTKGKDGGKDGRFTGTANCFPSKTSPWSGKMVIQAKHTTSPIASCSDGYFFSNKSSIVNKEIEKLKKIKSVEGLDYYLLFTNRKYTGNNDCEIIEKISTETKIPKENIAIIGNSTMDSLLTDNSFIVKKYKLNSYLIPFDFSDQDLRELVITFKEKLPEYQDQIGNEVEKIKREFNKIADEVKNAKNKLSSEYYEEVILSESYTYFEKIDNFLEDPKNDVIKDLYYDVVSEIRDLIVLKRGNFGAFEEIFIFIYNLVCQSSRILRGKKRFVNIFLHYMYHTCSIGKK